MTEFLEMGGYARYVWPSFVITLGLMALNVAWAQRALRRAQREARRRLAMRNERP